MSSMQKIDELNYDLLRSTKINFSSLIFVDVFVSIIVSTAEISFS